MTNPEARAKALEAAAACRRDNAALGTAMDSKTFWAMVSVFETYIVTGVQPSGEKAT